MSLTMRGHSAGRLIELQHQLETALSACVDYHNAMVRANVPDPVTGREDLQRLYERFELKLDPRSLFGERA